MRLEADAAFGQAENAETNDKQLQGGLYVQAQDLTGLQYRLSVLETANEKLREFKTSPFNSDDIKMAVENLTRNLQLLVEELDAAEKNLKETVEKYVFFSPTCDDDRLAIMFSLLLDRGKLMSRQKIMKVKSFVQRRNAMPGRRRMRYKWTIHQSDLLRIGL